MYICDDKMYTHAKITGTKYGTVALRNPKGCFGNLTVIQEHTIKK